MDTRISVTLKLYNKVNQFTYAQQTYKDGGYVDFDHWDDVADLQSNTGTTSLAYSIVNNAFSAAEKNRVSGESLSIAIIISPETGQIIEVYFTFRTKSKYATIPVSVYREIETELKCQIWFTPTEEGKKVNYLMRGWRQEVK